MKKLILLVCLVAFTHISNAQNGEASIAPTTDTMVTKTIEERLAKQEQEVEALKKDNESLKTQVKQLKSALKIGGNTKFTVSRRGSKQLIAE